MLNDRRTIGAIRIGVALPTADARPLISIWMPQGEEALCWPLVEPRAAELADWIRSSVFRKRPDDIDPHRYGTP